MKILISYPTPIKNEAALINQLVINGNWNLFHLRKPNYSRDELIKLLDNMNDQVLQKTVLHMHYDLREAYNLKGIHTKSDQLSSFSTSNSSTSVSCHSFKEITEVKEKVDYCFLSPIFDSISKPAYPSNFQKEELRAFLKKERNIKVIALGGTTNDNYQELLDLGFDGAAFLGSVWENQIICHSEHSEESIKR